MIVGVTFLYQRIVPLAQNASCGVIDDDGPDRAATLVITFMGKQYRDPHKISVRQPVCKVVSHQYRQACGGHVRDCVQNRLGDGSILVKQWSVHIHSSFEAKNIVALQTRISRFITWLITTEIHILAGAFLLETTISQDSITPLSSPLIPTRQEIAPPPLLPVFTLFLRSRLFCCLEPLRLAV